MVDHAPRLTDWPAFFAPVETAFGTRVRLADFDALQGDALWPGFAALAGLPATLPAVAAPRYPGPDRQAVVILQLLNTLVEDPLRRARMLQAWFALHPPGGSDASLLPPLERAALLDHWQGQSQAFAAARGYDPDLDAARAALAQEHWTPPEALPASALMDLIDLAQQAMPPAEPAPPRPRPPRGGEMSLVIRLRPWAADLARRLRRAAD